MIKGTGAAEAKGAVEQHIEGLPTPIREIMTRLRAVAVAGMPDAQEFLYHNAINYKRPESPGTWICYIAALKKHVNLGFYFGTRLPDPGQRLEGTGKRMRHVKVRTVEEAGATELADLIREAWTVSP